MSQENQVLECWKCGAAIARFPKPYSRREICAACEAELHVCRMCREFAPNVSEQCREDRAEPPRDKERANFCDWFAPAPRAHQAPSGGKGGADAAEDALAALFGAGPEDKPDAPERAAVQSEDDNLRALKDLFGDD